MVQSSLHHRLQTVRYIFLHIFHDRKSYYKICYSPCSRTHCMWFTSINIFKLMCENFSKAIVQLFTMYTLQLSLDVNNFIDDWCRYNHICTVDWYRAACTAGFKRYGTYFYTLFMIEKAIIKFAMPVFAHCMWFTSINIFKLKCENFTKAIIQLFTMYTLQLSLDDNNFMDDWCRYNHTCTVD